MSRITRSPGQQKLPAFTIQQQKLLTKSTRKKKEFKKETLDTEQKKRINI